VREATRASSTSGSLESIQVSRDGYIRLLPAAFRVIPLVHLISGLEEEPAWVDGAAGAQVSAIIGYTEWITTESPAITIGWDWQLGASMGSARCTRLGEVRSNVMLLDAEGSDLGPQRSCELLGEVIDARPWSAEVLSAVSIRYQK
jgi:Domain of unknown function (DUF4902)